MSNIHGFDPATGAWNDSLIGDYLWSNTNIGETLSDVLTPFSWSIIQSSFERHLKSGSGHAFAKRHL